MSKELTMSKLLFNLIKPILICLVTTFTAVFLSGCADTSIVKLDDSVEQIHNLVDYDGDGVIKAREKCDGTTIGASIDNYGCGIKTSKIEPFKIDIKFEHNSYNIPVVAYSEIRKLAGFLEKYPELDILIEGHTSKVGTVLFNQILSKNRAKSVAQVLENDFKINKSRISSIGYGFERLEEIGDTEQAHAANRRIMAEVSHTENFDELKWTIYTVDQVN